MAANGDRPRGERAHESTATDVARGVKGRRAPAVAVGLINERGHLVLWDDTRWPETVINREHAVTPPQWFTQPGQACPAACAGSVRVSPAHPPEPQPHPPHPAQGPVAGCGGCG